MTDETIFAAALEKPNPAERSAYLAEACADPEQRGRVEGLLAALEKAGGFLEKPAAGPGGSDFGPTRAFRSPGDPGDGPTRTHGEGTDDETDDALGFLAPPGRPDSLGRIDHYEVLEVFGRGGFGIVFRAFDDVLQRVVAVKVLSPSMAATSPARKRFLREARSAAIIQHENVVRIFETGEQPLPYLVMEFVPGETLQERLDRTGPLEVPEALRIARRVAEGLAAAHERGLIHRDIKPSNILIEGGPQPHVKITDFGLARAADDASLTRSGVVAGTPMYMAPEQAKGESLDHRADLFSLGSVMYAMLTGRPPFRAESTLAVLKRVADDTPRPIREVIPEVPEWLCRIVEKLHAKNPAERFQTAREVADLLADCEKQLAAHKELRDASRIPEAPRPTEAPPRQIGWGAVAVAALLLPIPIAIMDQTQAGTMSRWMAIPGACLMGVLAAAISVGTLQKLGWIDANGRAEVTGGPRRVGRKWKWLAAALVPALLVGGVLFGRFAVLYATDRGELELVLQDGLTSVIVLENPEGVMDANKLHPMVTDWLGMKQPHRLKLPPGKYQLNAGLSQHDRIIHWEVTTSGPFGSRTLRVPGEGLMGWSVIVTVERGQRTRVRPVLMSEPPPAPPSDGRTIPGWGTVVDPKRDCTFEGGTDGLTIHVSGGKHNLNPTPAFNDLSAPRVLRKAAGDFQLEVHVGSVGPPGPPADSYLGAGLLLWQDERNFVRFLRAATASPRRTFVHFEHFRDGRLIASTGLDVPNRLTALRAVRAGNTFRFYWRSDGGQWSQYAVGPVSLSESLEVGVCAINTSAEPFAAGFSGLQLGKPNDGGFVPLFNGKDLKAWQKPYGGEWKLDGGVLRGSAKSGEYGVLASIRDYANFELRAELRLTGPGNGGVLFRSENGYQVEVEHDYTGGIARSKPFAWLVREKHSLVEPGAWFRLEVVADGPRLTTKVNGRVVSSVTDRGQARGYIGLEVDGRETGAAVLECRKLEVKELPAARAKP